MQTFAIEAASYKRLKTKKQSSAWFLAGVLNNLSSFIIWSWHPKVCVGFVQIPPFRTQGVLQLTVLPGLLNTSEEALTNDLARSVPSADVVAVRHLAEFRSSEALVSPRQQVLDEMVKLHPASRLKHVLQKGHDVRGRPLVGVFERRRSGRS